VFVFVCESNISGTAAAAADGTIPSLPGVISGACVRFMFGKTSLALVYTRIVVNTLRLLLVIAVTGQ